MNLFGNYFKKKPPLDVRDPVFGRLNFSEGLWSLVPPTPGAEFMITVDAPETGPTDRQRAFFHNIRSSLSEFECRARNFMRSRVDESVDVSRVSVYSIEIGSDDETERQQFVLELSDSDALVVHRVLFRWGEPVDYGCDD
jgi:hypothetical protein